MLPATLIHRETVVARVPSNPRLLLAIPESEGTRGAVASALPGILSAFASELGEGPWPGVEAVLAGNLERQMPELAPEDLPGLRFVQSLYTGLDGFAFDRVRPEAEVAGNGGAYAPFVAEHALALALGLAHDLLGGHRQVLAGRLRPTEAMTFLGGKHALLVGYGAIAEELALRLGGLGMRVVGVARRAGPRPGAERVVALGALEEELPRAELVVNCLPLSRSTERLFDAERIARMRPDAMFVNIGRAATVDAHAMDEHLRAHPNFRYASDVWWGEQFATGRLDLPFALEGRSNVLGSPHRAASVKEAGPWALDRALENLARFFRGERPRWVESRSEYTGSSGTSALR